MQVKVQVALERRARLVTAATRFGVAGVSDQTGGGGRQAPAISGSFWDAFGIGTALDGLWLECVIRSGNGQTRLRRCFWSSAGRQSVPRNLAEDFGENTGFGTVVCIAFTNENTTALDDSFRGSASEQQ